MKADDAEALASIEDRVEAAVTVGVEPCLSEPKKQLPGRALDDRRTREGRPRDDIGETLGCAVGLEVVRGTPPTK